MNKVQTIISDPDLLTLLQTTEYDITHWDKYGILWFDIFQNLKFFAWNVRALARNCYPQYNAVMAASGVIHLSLMVRDSDTP